MALQQLEARLAAILEAKIDKKIEQVKDSLQETLTQLFQDMMIHKKEQPPQQDTITTTPAAKRGGDVGRRNHRGLPSSEDSETDDEDSTLDSSTDSDISDGTTTASKHKTFYFCVKKSALDVHGGYWPKVLHWYSADLSLSPSSYGGGGAIANNQLTTLKMMPPHGFNQGAGVVVLNSVIYFLGGSPLSDIGLELPNSSGVLRRTSDVFCFDTRCPHEGWKKASSSMIAPRYNPAAYAVDGKIYVFGGSYGGANYPFAEVYVPRLRGGPLQIQQRFAPSFSSDAILMPIQADDYGCNMQMRRRHKLLVYNQSDGTLCSYNLVSEEWTVLDKQFGNYYASFAAVGDVLYRYDCEGGGGGRCVYAYDLVKRKWFSEPVKGLQTRNVFPPLSGYCPTFLFPVGNADLCLAWYGFYRGTSPALNSMFCTVFAVDKSPYDDTSFVATIKSSYRIGYSNESDDCIHCFAV